MNDKEALKLDRGDIVKIVFDYNVDEETIIARIQSVEKRYGLHPLATYFIKQTTLTKDHYENKEKFGLRGINDIQSCDVHYISEVIEVSNKTHYSKHVYNPSVFKNIRTEGKCICGSLSRLLITTFNYYNNKFNGIDVYKAINLYKKQGSPGLISNDQNNFKIKKKKLINWVGRNINKLAISKKVSKSMY